MNYIKTLLLSSILIACTNDNKISHQRISLDWNEDASILALIANPDKYHDKKISTLGYLNLEFEGNAIYLHKTDSDNHLQLNGLWVKLTKEQENEIDSLNLNEHYVLLEGTFNKNGQGHGTLYSGEIKDITSVIAW